MSVSSPALSTTTSQEGGWLHSRDWDLTFISLSVILVTIPYLTYLGLTELAPILAPIAGQLNTSVDDLSRNIINGMVALLVGGPHMYATFQRTAFDKSYASKHSRMLWSSLVIPVVVITLAVLDLRVLLTVFFFWASIHVLHQIIFITELYNQKKKTRNKTFYKVADYAVILTSLYPIAAYRMSVDNFAIGLNNISEMVGKILGIVGLGLGPWMYWVAGGLFAVSLVLWLVATFMQWQEGSLHGPKTLFIGLTVVASFFVPALGNLDTAFQGMNFWHSLQYISLTWMLNNLRQRRGELDKSPFIKKMAEDGEARRFYLFNVGLSLADIGLAVVIFFIMKQVATAAGNPNPFDFAFDRAYYIAVLSFLWIHYYHDHFLFTEPDVIIG